MNMFRRKLFLLGAGLSFLSFPARASNKESELVGVLYLLDDSSIEFINDFNQIYGAFGEVTPVGKLDPYTQIYEQSTLLLYHTKWRTIDGRYNSYNSYDQNHSELLMNKDLKSANLYVHIRSLKQTKRIFLNHVLSMTPVYKTK